MSFSELNFSPSGSGRSFYTDEEDLALIQFVKANKFLYSFKGNNLYKEAEKAKVWNYCSLFLLCYCRLMVLLSLMCKVADSMNVC